MKDRVASHIEADLPTANSTTRLLSALIGERNTETQHIKNESLQDIAFAGRAVKMCQDVQRACGGGGVGRAQKLAMGDMLRRRIEKEDKDGEIAKINNTSAVYGGGDSSDDDYDTMDRRHWPTSLDTPHPP
eukprot:CAMPEP_0114125656 /NCGR_PEP_ID=MMETSP0043_2-20121206/9414_1 /TAXON_ID=464988 /ORGANISM="Hemiselmis andersenii, Strain CCMP644" /LENGTH=130 /DNA_ID=CAMNT_0001218591 /DNA_START=1 /DNA_END=389 /DNA_ORIENTATION=+